LGGAFFCSLYFQQTNESISPGRRRDPDRVEKLAWAMDCSREMQIYFIICLDRQIERAKAVLEVLRAYADEIGANSR
jgi:hypothetical protein